MSLIVKIGKKGKKMLKGIIDPPAKHYVRYTRRIEQIKTNERVCAMTFDDGPMNMPCSPDLFEGKCLTDVLLDTLEKYDAHGTFDVIGDTKENYPDEAGALGSAAWGGIRYDHYPDINADENGGALRQERLIHRMIDGGHQITNHGYRHIIFGKKPFVYGKRTYLGNYHDAFEDIDALHRLMKEKYHYEMVMSRPAHYVDKIDRCFTSYDVYDQMGYAYMAASFDGAGWLPSTLPESAAFEAEVRAMVRPIEKALANNPDFFCGQIIFQKDGYNMAKRTPVAVGLEQQLKLLKEHGYRVVTVKELLTYSPFKDLGKEDALFEKACALIQTHAIVFSDNTLRPDAPMNWGELAMLLAPKEIAVDERRERMLKNRKPLHPYATAMEYCKKEHLIPRNAKWSQKVSVLPEQFFAPTQDFTRRSILMAFKDPAHS